MTLAPAPVRARPGTVTKRLMFFASGSQPDLAEAIASHLDVSITPQTGHEFANGERFVRYDTSVPGSAHHITVIQPCYPYARQDKKHRGREPITAHLVADLFATAGAQRIMTVDLHTPQTQGFFDSPVDHLLAQPLLADHIRARYTDTDITVVAPDAGRARLAETWANLLGGRPIAFIQRRDTPTRPHRFHPGSRRRAGQGLRRRRRHD